MSLITDALKRAEEERVQKKKKVINEAMERAALQAVKESEGLVESALDARQGVFLGTPAPVGHAPQQALGPDRSGGFVFHVRDSFLFGGLMVIALIALLMIPAIFPRWPAFGRGFSLTWNPAQETGAYQAAPAPAITPPAQTAPEPAPAITPPAQTAPAPVPVVTAPARAAAVPTQIAPAPAAPEEVKPVPQPVVKAEVVKPASMLPFVLSGISVMGEERYAFVNDQIVTEGDSLNGGYIREISNRDVTIETKAGEIKLKISS